MLSSPSLPWSRLCAQAVVAGLTGAVTIDLYLWLTTVLPAHGSMVAFWQGVAATALGKIALTDPAYAVTGVAIHCIVSVVWAAAYAYLAATKPFVNERWLVSGIVYGAIVYVIMQLMLLAANAYVFPPNPGVVYNAIFAHVAFFGVPVAYVVALMQSRHRQ